MLYSRYLSLALTLSISAHARLGETEAECLQRYGPAKNDAPTRMTAKSFPVLEGAPERAWEYQGWYIRAASDPMTGRAIRVKYLKLSKPGVSPVVPSRSRASGWHRRRSRHR